MKPYIFLLTLTSTIACLAQQTPPVATQFGKFQTLGSQQGAAAVDPYAEKLPQGETPRTPLMASPGYSPAIGRRTPSAKTSI